ncbi:hypothetical protein C8R47DRAFT_311804 [Mycena vitilis]|nr:hypothetical protein C8R47DRAFT_311804 [Mycena vitilis]
MSAQIWTRRWRGRSIALKPAADDCKVQYPRCGQPWSCDELEVVPPARVLALAQPRPSHFNRCGITSNFSEYGRSLLTGVLIISEMMVLVFVDSVRFEMEISKSKTAHPTGFLFVCPPEAFIVGRSSLCWPKCPAYWSFDPSGAQRLSMEEAIGLGFPTLQFGTNIWGYHWDDSVYAGVRKFHQAKGFDPDSQDIARHLGYPLHQPSTNACAPFAHIDDADASAGDEDQDFAMDVDREWAEEDSGEIFPMNLD